MPSLLVAIDARKAVEGQRKWTQATDKVALGAKRAASGVERLDKRMDAAGRRASGMAGKMAALAGSFISVVGLTKVVRIIADFEQVMSTVGGVTQATAESMVLLTAAAKEMGATTRFTAKQAGDSLLFLARAGFDATEAIAALPDTLNLAAAGAIDLGTAGDIASNVLAQFSLEVKDLGRVTDVLIKTTNSSNTNILQLADAMRMAGPVAGMLGISVEKASAAIGVLGNAGIQASLAGTQMRGIFAALLGPTDKAKVAIREMGLTIEELNPATNELIGVFKKLRDANMSAEQAFEIFGRRNVAGAGILARMADSVEDLWIKTLLAEGAAKDMADAMEDNLAGSFRLVRSALEAVALAMGTSGFTGAMRGMLGTMRSGLIGVADFIKGLTDTEEKLDTATKAITALAVALGVTGLLAALTAVITAVKFLGVAMLVNPWTLAVAAIALAVGALYAYRDTTIEIGDKTVNVGVSIEATWETIKIVIEAAKDELSSFFGVLSTKGGSLPGLGTLMVGAMAARFAPNSQVPTELDNILGMVPGVDSESNVTGRIFDEQYKRILEERVRAGLIAGEPGLRRLITPAQFETQEREARQEDLRNQLLGPLDPDERAVEQIGKMGPFRTEEHEAADNAANALRLAYQETFNNAMERHIRLEDKMFSKEFQAKQQRVIDLGNEMGDSFTNAFNDMILGAQSAEEAMRNLALEIARIALTESVTGPAGRSLGAGLSGAFGGLLGVQASDGTLTAAYSPQLAKGGIVTKPTMALIGESGPEAVIPLGKGGVLGTTVFNVNITTPDAGSFRKSRRQIAQQVQSAMGR